ncbi:hypothetical protein JCM19240_4060 [Vibrio maritimus]|uniref:Uncharacterized protein n=1 Tax=Vibrio maritimus TaxID=990268 RepID=A0A090T3I6_9VIBR|nr:hypothetical protein JCM19240_4060 [Vibrio maritimus]
MKMVKKRCDIIFSVSKRGKIKRDDVEAVIEILAKITR